MKIKSTTIRPNELCPCGSGKKFKNCCRNKKTEISLKDKYKTKYDIVLKTPEQVDGIRKCGELLLSIMEGVEAMIRPGLKTDDINTYVHEQTIKAGAVPAPLNYRGFPKSVCVSVNDVICHGIPGEQVLEDGDIVNVDLTTIVDGFYGDSSETFCIGNVPDSAQNLVRVAASAMLKTTNSRPSLLLIGCKTTMLVAEVAIK